MGESVGLKDIFRTLKKRLWLIVLITALAGIIGGAVSYFLLTPIYQVSTQILVNQAKGDQSVYNSNEVQTNLQLINTYNVIIKSPVILDKVSKELNLGITLKELNSKITVASEKNSQVVNISVEDTNAQQAALIANKTAEVFQTEIADIMNIDNVNILANATAEDNPAPIKPKPLINIALAIVVGLLVSVGLAFLLEYLDNTVKDEQELERLLGLPVLGVVGLIPDPKSLKKSKHLQNSNRVRSESLGS